MKPLSCSLRGERLLVSLSGAVLAAFAFLFIIGVSTVVGQTSDADVVTVQSRQEKSQLVAYGQVGPVVIVPVSAAEPGVVTGLQARPGTHVRAGQSLAHMSGPAIDSLVVQGEADVRSAQSQLDAARKSLDIARQQLPSHLTTRQAVQQAESAEAQARSGLVNAQSRLKTVRQLMTVSSPADGIVLQLNSADGALVSAGQPILTIQPANGLWLVANYYGADLAVIRVGMTGQFRPADGGAPLKVRVASIPGTLAAGGGESIAFEALNSKHTWISGEAGMVALDLPLRQMVVVPTRALVLNQGKWWVMIHSAAGDRAEEVVPGPTQGWDTFIVSGLAPGTKVVVNNAYLLFHASITEQFQIPD
ncbi:MAG: efflux RND transporter periplasmic adaptor subunit [Alphaproteobacteria bacterium]|nr:efflux RND transporter periplasmic adaptor subunit [Alphaproteobacteria bacterium]